jgi:hypothetical protein
MLALKARRLAKNQSKARIITDYRTIESSNLEESAFLNEGKPS